MRAESPRNANYDFLYLSYLRRLVLGAYVNNIDLYANAGEEEDDDDDTNRDTKPGAGIVARWLPRPLARSTWRRKLKCGWIPMVILKFYLIIMAVITMDVIYLYKFEINSMRLKHVRDLIREYGPMKQVAIQREYIEMDRINASLFSTGGGASGLTFTRSEVIMSLNQFRSILETRSYELQWALGYLGDKFIATGFIINCAYLSAIFLGCAIYLIFVWLYLFNRRYDCQFHRDQIDHRAEQLRVDATCKSKVIEYLESNRIYTNIVEGKQHNSPLLIGTGRAAARDRFARSNQRTSSPASYRRRTDYLAVTSTSRSEPDYASDTQVRRLLMQMLASGALRPLNRCKLWLQVRDIMHAFLYLNLIGYTILFDTCNMYTLYQTSTARVDPGELCLLAILVIAGCGFVFYFTTVILSSLDQSLLVRHVLRLIRECVRLNEREFVIEIFSRPSRPAPPDAGKHSRLGTRIALASTERVNSNYLFVLMTYKMFVTQFKPFRHTNRGIFLIVASGLFIMPALARIHMPYLDQGAINFRLGFIIVSVYTLMPLNAMSLPICYLRARCQELYIELASLIAHIARVRRDEEIIGGSGVYNEHAVTVLLKELSNPQQMLEQFTVQSIGLQTTYSNLVKLHFWWGLIVLSVLLNTQGVYQDQFFGSYSRDPLGVWCFRLV